MSVRVVARIRPLLEHELDKDTIVRSDWTDSSDHFNLVKIPNPKNETEEFSFAFNGVYAQSASQEELFNAEGQLPPRAEQFSTVLTTHSGTTPQGAVSRS
jgi:hypothetical protein